MKNTEYIVGSKEYHERNKSIRIGSEEYNKILRDEIKLTSNETSPFRKLYAMLKVTPNPSQIVDALSTVYKTNGEDTNGIQDPAGNSPLLLAIAAKNELAATHLLMALSRLTTKPEQLKNIINFKFKGQENYYSNTPLTLAIKNGMYKIANELLDLGADPNIASSYGNFTPLHLAIFRIGLDSDEGTNEAILLTKKLIEKGAAKTAVDAFGNIPAFMLTDIKDLNWKNIDFIMPIQSSSKLKAYSTYSVKEVEEILEKNFSSFRDLYKFNNNFIGVQQYSSDSSCESYINNSFLWGDLSEKLQAYHFEDKSHPREEWIIKHSGELGSLINDLMP